MGAFHAAPTFMGTLPEEPMTRRSLIPLLFLGLGATAAQAQIRLIAIGRVSGAYEDLAARTAAPLENGIPGNRLGGLGSGLAYAGGDTFLAVPDRGPNAKPYDSSVDDTASYIARFHTFTLSLAPADPGAALPFVLSTHLRDTTLLHSREPLAYGPVVPALNAADRTHYFSGRSDNFDASLPSTNPLNARFDPESIRVSRNGKRVYISDEYGPFIYEFDRASGQRRRAIALPAHFAIARLSAVGADEIAANTSGRVTNKGMEGLAITPDGAMLVGMMQSPLLQDGGTNGATTRLVTVDLATSETHEYAYPLTNIGTLSKPKYPTVSDLVAINGHEFLVDERDGKGLGDGSVAVFKRLYRIDLRGAADVSALEGAAALAPKAMAKSLVLDVVAELNARGLAGADIPAKLEGLAFGQDVVLDGEVRHTLFLANDNDFVPSLTDSLHPAGQDNPNQFFVFAFGDRDLPGFVPQRLRQDGEDNEGDRD